MSSKLKGALQATINILGNMIILGALPMEYKPLSLVVFNTAQVIYAYLDPTYTLQVIGRRLGRKISLDELKREIGVIV